MKAAGGPARRDHRQPSRRTSPAFNHRIGAAGLQASAAARCLPPWRCGCVRRFDRAQPPAARRPDPLATNHPQLLATRARRKQSSHHTPPPLPPLSTSRLRLLLRPPPPLPLKMATAARAVTLAAAPRAAAPARRRAVRCSAEPPKAPQKFSDEEWAAAIKQTGAAAPAPAPAPAAAAAVPPAPKAVGFGGARENARPRRACVDRNWHGMWCDVREPPPPPPARRRCHGLRWRRSGDRERCARAEHARYHSFFGQGGAPGEELAKGGTGGLTWSSIQ